MTNTELKNHIEYSLSIGADITLTEEDIKQIIKSLERESVLDKLRTKIEQFYEETNPYFRDEYLSALERGKEIAYRVVLDVIDKYRRSEE